MSRNITLADCVDYVGTPLRKELITFEGPNKHEKGAYVNILYNGKPLHLKLPALTTTWGARRGGDDPASAKGAVKLQLEVPENTARPEFNQLLAALKTIDAAVDDHVTANAAKVFGESGVNLKGKTLENTLKSIELKTFQKYGAYRKKSDKYPPSLQVKLASDTKTGDMRTKIFARRQGGGGGMVTMNWEDVVKGSEVTAYVTVKGYFVNLNMITVQAEASSMLVSPAYEATAADLFPEFAAAEPAEESHKRKRDGGDDDDAAEEGELPFGGDDF